MFDLKKNLIVIECQMGRLSALSSKDIVIVMLIKVWVVYNFGGNYHLNQEWIISDQWLMAGRQKKQFTQVAIFETGLYDVNFEQSW